jgi:LysM repeat protein
MGNSHWGPKLQHQDVGAGSNDERAALIRDAKRKALLSGTEDLSNPATRHKRRTSDDISTSFIPQEDPDTESLVYIHHVRPGDTLPGLTIKYNCQATVLRKANRIWPNDPIQTRKIIFIPVDAAGIKGKPVLSPEFETIEEDLLGDQTIFQHESPQLNRSPKQGATAFQDCIPTASLSPASTSNNTEPEYKHDSWVILPNDKQPTEIARLFRQNLGFFPRARRKSIGFSDRSTSRNTSFDLGRPVQSSPLIRPQDTLSENPSPSRRPTSKTRPSFSQASRTRSSSNPVASFLRGPGGVGSMGRNVRTIGPGNERLTELFGAHLPSVAPPEHQTVFTPWTPSLMPETDGIARTAVDANGVPIDTSAGIDLQDVGGAIESWVRKLAKKAATALETNPATASTTRSKGKGNVGGQGLGLAGGIGDLIELVDAFEVGDGGEDMAREDHHHMGSEPLPAADPLHTTPNVASTGSKSVDAWPGMQGEVRGRKVTRNTDGSA